MNAVTIAQSAAVVATAARPRVTVSRANRAVRVPLGRSDVARVPSSSAARRRAVCRADKSDAEKTVSALDAILAGSQDEAAPEEEPAPAPAAPERKPGEVSDAMKAKLRDEYVGLGGTPSKPMPSNLFLNIILGISALAILCKVGGILP